MIRLGVIGDTHCQIGEAKKAIKKMGDIETLLHTGDHYQDACDLAQEISIPIKGVVGNCDWQNPNGPKELLLKYDEISILLTHGHLYRVRFGIDVILDRALKLQAQVAVFGHTHVPLETTEKGVLLFNPGSVATPRGGSKPSFGILTISDGQVSGEILTL